MSLFVMYLNCFVSLSQVCTVIFTLDISGSGNILAYCDGPVMLLDVLLLHEKKIQQRPHFYTYFHLLCCTWNVDSAKTGVLALVGYSHFDI